MNLATRYAGHPDDVRKYDTGELRSHFLFEQVFVQDEISLCYTHSDRIVFGGAWPVSKRLALSGGKDFGTDEFLERRELGCICISGTGNIVVDGIVYPMRKGDGIYIGKSTKEVLFETGKDGMAGGPAKFYLVSAPAHAEYPAVFIPIEKANPKKTGNPENLNTRTIYQYIHPAVCQSCQLLMGMTVLEPGSVWNTMPCHTHERRMEVYFYFDLKKDARVFHLHGQSGETRHIVLANEQAVISPSWSIHSGVGTAPYTFIWGMAGENQNFDDMDTVAMSDLR